MGTSSNGAGAQRGGWKNPLLTDNTMKDPKAQPSLTEGLKLGVMTAHRNQMRDERMGDGRNFRRSLPLGGQAKPGVRETSMAKRKPGQTASPEQAGAMAMDEIDSALTQPRSNSPSRVLGRRGRP